LTGAGIRLTDGSVQLQQHDLERRERARPVDLRGGRLEGTVIRVVGLLGLDGLDVGASDSPLVTPSHSSPLPDERSGSEATSSSGHLRAPST
jgi:hypothetical protein